MANERKPAQDDLDNRGDQLNQNNEKFWKARGHEDRPDDWETRKPDAHHNEQPGGNPSPS